MLTLYHAPMSRSSRIVHLIEEMGIGDKVDIRIVTIPRADGSGGRDPSNPHGEGKVPLLVHDGVEIRETNAIMLYLTDLFPEKGLGIPVGDPRRGAYLSWLAWYGNVLEPVVVLDYAQVSHPALTATFRGVPEAIAHLEKGLSQSPYLLGDSYTAADLICASPYLWFPDITPDSPVIRAWIERCKNRAAGGRMMEFDAQARANAG
jgi:Glutathione S-transferase